MKESEIIKKYGNTQITVNVRVGNASMGVSSSDAGSRIMAVKEAVKCWSGTHWRAENKFVEISFDEDYGHTIKIKREEK